MSGADESRRLSASRRALFPSLAGDDDSDLGHMSPLSSAGINSDSESSTDQHYFKSLKNHSVNDYEILGSIYKQDCGGEQPDVTPMQKKVVSPLEDAPISLEGDNTVIPDTPVKESPLLKLETPHDTLIQSNVLPKLVRKTQIDEEESPEHKQQKLESSSTKLKVRTALFQEQNMCVPVQSFYAKTASLKIEPKVFVNREEQKRKKKKDNVYLCGRKTRKNRFGQINSGVRHKIKKPKQKKLSKVQLLKAAINLLENSPLNGYLAELQELQNKPKRIEPINEKIGNRKRERSPENTKKFEVTLKGHDFCFVKRGEGKVPTAFEGEEEEKLIENECISSLIDTLEEDKENSGLAPPTKRQKIELLSPISQMCDTTSGLAINSPKKARNLTALLENLTPPQTCLRSASAAEMEARKLFPIFDVKTAKRAEEKTGKTQHVKKWKALPANQMLLDAGQKKFGPTQCPECEIVYHMGDPSEEIMHLNYHNAGNVLKFNGWKNEEVLVNFVDSRVIRVKPNDSKIWWKKVVALLEIVNRDLGFYDVQLNTEDSHVYLYIKNKTIAGCLVAEHRSAAHKKLENNGVDLCTEEEFPVKCGVSRIWVACNHRRAGIGSILMDCLRANFIFGYVLQSEDIALSSPTEMGHNFAKKYFKTSNYLMYM